MIPELDRVNALSLDSKTEPKALASRVQAMFLEVMIKAMEESIEAEDGLFAGSSSSEIYRGMFREHLAASMSNQLQSPLERQLQQNLENTVPAAHEQEQSVPALPIPGTVTSPVGWRRDPINGEMRFHHGTDIAAPIGTPVKAVEGGVVLESGPRGGYGNAVIIQTQSGQRMLYGHNQFNLVRPGDRVQQGETIAQVGSTGRSTGPHLHFEVME